MHCSPRCTMPHSHRGSAQPTRTTHPDALYRARAETPHPAQSAAWRPCTAPAACLHWRPLPIEPACPTNRMHAAWTGFHTRSMGPQMSHMLLGVLARHPLLGKVCSAAVVCGVVHWGGSCCRQVPSAGQCWGAQCNLACVFCSCLTIAHKGKGYPGCLQAA